LNIRVVYTDGSTDDFHDVSDVVVWGPGDPQPEPKPGRIVIMGLAMRAWRVLPQQDVANAVVAEIQKGIFPEPAAGHYPPFAGPLATT